MERGMTPIVLEGPESGPVTRSGSGGTWLCSRRLGSTTSTRAAARAKTPASTGRNPRSGSSSYGRRVARPLSRSPWDQDAAEGCHPDIQSRDGDQPRRISTRAKDEEAETQRAVRNPVSERQGPQASRADAVIDVSETWSSPTPRARTGFPAIGERDCASRIIYGNARRLRKRSGAVHGQNRKAVLGAGHSAIGTLTDLARSSR